MSTKLEERQKLRQDEIITAARRCFRASGFHAASMSQIASEARLSVGQIYRYFSNKDAIIEEMIRRIIDSRIEEMQGKTLVEGMPQALAWRQTLNEDDDAVWKRCRGKREEQNSGKYFYRRRNDNWRRNVGHAVGCRRRRVWGYRSAAGRSVGPDVLHRAIIAGGLSACPCR